MKIILDECLPRRLVRDLHPHLATTVPREGWAGIKNGVLLKLIIPAFDVFITLHAVNSRYETLQPMVPDLLKAISKAKSGIVIPIGN